MSAEVEAWVPAFPGQRPPFQRGHELTLRHGAFSARKVGPIAEELTADLLAADGNDYLRTSRWSAALSAWARAEARVLLLTAWLEDNGGVGLNSEGAVVPALSALKDWESRAEKARTRLGLDPLSAARLGRDTAAGQLDAATLMARLAEAEKAEKRATAAQEDSNG